MLVTDSLSNSSKGITLQVHTISLQSSGQFWVVGYKCKKLILN